MVPSPTGVPVPGGYMSVIGVDVGGTKIAAGRMGPDLAVTGPVVIPTPKGGMAITNFIGPSGTSCGPNIAR